ncbi:MAG TPA: hypothetical protein VKA19_12725, partial [Alphaproteobacteria bacterium]|nr:hypothetical protein [Alphaproteobacteria bacterium]
LWKTMKQSRRRDPEWHQIHRALFATIVAILVILATVSPIDRSLQYYWCFAGLASAACRAFKRDYAKRSAEKPAISGFASARLV